MTSSVSMNEGMGTSLFKSPSAITPHGALERKLASNWLVAVAGVKDMNTNEWEEHVVKEAFELTPKRSGQLFLFVNDAVLGLPYHWDVFYRFNTGKSVVEVTDLEYEAVPG